MSFRSLRILWSGTIWLLLVATVRAEPVKEAGWPQWRGPDATGSARDSARPPIHWSPAENVAWKTRIPGHGHSTPVTSGELVFVTAAIPVGVPLEPRYSGRPGAHNNRPVTTSCRFAVVCLDRATGTIHWETTVRTAVPHEGGHETGSLASASPITDGERVYAFFGSRGLYALDLQGRVLWEKDLGEMHSKHGHGEGASPVLDSGILVVNWDEQEQSFLTALDARTGLRKWRVDREELTSWSTPIVARPDPGGPAQVIVSGTRKIRAYHLETGELLWRSGGLSANVVASPVYHRDSGTLVAGSSYDTRRMIALRLPGATLAEGDLDRTERLLWEKDSRTPYVPSLLLRDEAVYHLTHYQGVLTRTHVITGETMGGPWRLFGMREIYASPVSAGEVVYVTDRTGATVVLRHQSTGPEDRLVLARNEIGEAVNASLALLDDALLIRGERHLFLIRETAP